MSLVVCLNSLLLSLVLFPILISMAAKVLRGEQIAAIETQV